MIEVRAWNDVTPALFAGEIRPLGEPAILRGAVADWPLVRTARGDPLAAARLLAGHASAGPFEFAFAPPESRGLLHYQDDMRAFTFTRRSASFAEIVAAMLREAVGASGAVVAVQSADFARSFPALAGLHRLDLLPPEVAPRIWLGTRATVAAHNDPLENIACVAAGRRRFTLFPPEQIGNLYMGPLHVTPAGTPISMVRVTEPDLERYPRFAAALEAAQVAELEPGDALYIPYQWYHHVEALDPFNVLVNYWWNDAPTGGGSPWDALLHAIMAIRHLPPAQRRAWRANFDHYAFLANGSAGAHLPPFARGLLDESGPPDFQAMRAQIIEALSRPADESGSK